MLTTVVLSIALIINTCLIIQLRNQVASQKRELDSDAEDILWQNTITKRVSELGNNISHIYDTCIVLANDNVKLLRRMKHLDEYGLCNTGNGYVDNMSILLIDSLSCMQPIIDRIADELRGFLPFVEYRYKDVVGICVGSLDDVFTITINTKDEETRYTFTKMDTGDKVTITIKVSEQTERIAAIVDRYSIIPEITAEHVFPILTKILGEGVMDNTQESRKNIKPKPILTVIK